MTKFKTDTTKEGYNILALFGPDDCMEYAGVVEYSGELHAATWDEDGREMTGGVGDLSEIAYKDDDRRHPLRIK